MIPWKTSLPLLHAGCRDAIKFYVFLLLTLTWLFATSTDATCSRKIENCQRLKAGSGYNGPIKPNDPLIMMQQRDHPKLVATCRAQPVLTNVIRCMDRAFKSHTCRRDFVYSQMTKYYDAERSIDGMKYFCENYDVVKNAESCMKKYNPDLISCRRRQMERVEQKIQSGTVDKTVICGATLAKRNCVRLHLLQPCGAKVVEVLSKTMMASIPRSCDEYVTVENAEGSTAAILTESSSLIIAMVLAGIHIIGL